MKVRLIDGGMIPHANKGEATSWDVGLYRSLKKSSIVLVYYASGLEGVKRALYMSSMGTFYESINHLADGYILLEEGTVIEITA